MKDLSIYLEKVCEGVFDDQDDNVMFKNPLSPLWTSLSKGIYSDKYTSKQKGVGDLINIPATSYQRGILTIKTFNPYDGVIMMIPEAGVLKSILPDFEGIDARNVDIETPSNPFNTSKIPILDESFLGKTIAAHSLTSYIKRVENLDITCSSDATVIGFSPISFYEVDSIKNCTFTIDGPLNNGLNSIPTLSIEAGGNELPVLSNIKLNRGFAKITINTSSKSRVLIVGRLKNVLRLPKSSVIGGQTSTNTQEVINFMSNRLSEGYYKNFENLYEVDRASMKDLGLDIHGTSKIVVQCGSSTLNFWKLSDMTKKNIKDIAQNFFVDCSNSRENKKKYLDSVAEDLLNNPNKHTTDGWLVTI